MITKEYKLEGKFVIPIKLHNHTGLLGQKKLIIDLTDKGEERIQEYLEILRVKWREMLDLAIAGERAQLDEIIKENPFMVNMMVFFGVTDLPTLSRLNLRFLLEGKHLCYKCKKELTRFTQRFSVSDVRKFRFKLPRGMTTRDDLCEHRNEKKKRRISLNLYGISN